MRERAEILIGRGRRLYLVNDPHWTIEGHALAGESLAEYLLDN
jgi:hypothetical protein